MERNKTYLVKRKLLKFTLVRIDTHVQLLYLGDMITTAISVARNCGMVGGHDRVVIVEAHKPENNNDQAKIEWELSELNADESPDASDYDSEVGDMKSFFKICYLLRNICHASLEKAVVIFKVFCLWLLKFGELMLSYMYRLQLGTGCT